MLFEAYQLLFYSIGKTEKTFFLIYSSYLLIYKLHQCLLTVIGKERIEVEVKICHIASLHVF